MNPISNVKVLTFDFFGTVLNLHDSLRPAIAEFFTNKGINIDPEEFRQSWRYRQRIEQFQDTILMLGHSGYFSTVRRALKYTIALYKTQITDAEIDGLMDAWQALIPFDDVKPGLEKLKTKFKLVALSNGDEEFLYHLARNRIRWNFDEIISSSHFGAFKPHPGVYRKTAMMLNLEMHECMMVSSNSFDVLGARTCGFRSAYVNRYNLPYEDMPFYPDVEVRDFNELANALV